MLKSAIFHKTAGNGLCTCKERDLKMILFHYAFEILHVLPVLSLQVLHCPKESVKVQKTKNYGNVYMFPSHAKENA